MMQFTQLMNVLALALIHFTWIAAIIGIAVWTGRQLISSATANVHWLYRIGMIGMVSMLLAIPLAGWFAWSASRPATNRPTIDIATNLEKPPHDQLDIPNTAVQPGGAGFGLKQAALSAERDSALAAGINLSTHPRTAAATSIWQSTLTSVFPWIAMAYIGGLAMMLVRTGTMLIGCHRILSQAEIYSDPRLAKIIKQRARQIGLAWIPAVATCQRVKSPVIVGIWKPVILFPAAMLSGLTLAEIEIVLCHELAHFRRLDPVIVFVQRTMETILFFHPTVWLISRSLDRDREICCDEMVLATGASRIEYASVLCRVAEFSVARPNGMSLAISGSSSNELVFRVGNILGQNNDRPISKRSWSILIGAGSAIVITASFLLSNLPHHFVIPVVNQETEQAEKGNEQDQGKSEKKDVLQQDSVDDKYAVSFSDYRHDYAQGFEVISKLLKEAEGENEPPETLAKLRYEAAKLQRFVQLNRRDGFEQDFSISIGILREVVDTPSIFLENKSSAAWFRNCVSLLAAIYEDNKEPKTVIDSLYETAIEDIDAAMGLTERDQFLFMNGLRVSASDRALHAKDWPAAIKLVQPVVDEADEFLEHTDGAYQISMAVRQQSMFLARNNDIEKSAALIDTICEKLGQARALDEATKIINLCMLRGKNLINLDAEVNKDLFEKGWENYQTLAKRAKTYDGPDRAKVLRSCFNMDRLAIASLPPEKVDQAIELVRETMAFIEADPKLQDPKFGVFWYLEDMSRMTVSKIREAVQPDNDDPFPDEQPVIPDAKQLQDDVKALIAKYSKE